MITGSGTEVGTAAGEEVVPGAVAVEVWGAEVTGCLTEVGAGAVEETLVN